MNFIYFECIMITNRWTFIIYVYNNRFRMVKILHSLMIYECLLLTVWSIYILTCKNVCDVHKGYGTKEEESLLSHISQS